MKKTDRKNKTNLMVSWPKSIFTIKELNDYNKDFIEITLRVRLKKAVDSGEVKEIGVLHNGKGRPTTVFVHGNVTESHIDAAIKRQVLLNSTFNVNVLSVNKNTQVKDTSVATETNKPSDIITSIKQDMSSMKVGV